MNKRIRVQLLDMETGNVTEYASQSDVAALLRCGNSVVSKARRTNGLLFKRYYIRNFSYSKWVLPEPKNKAVKMKNILTGEISNYKSVNHLCTVHGYGHLSILVKLKENYKYTNVVDGTYVIAYSDDEFPKPKYNKRCSSKKSVKLKDTTTGAIVDFKSIAACARFMGVNSNSIVNRLNGNTPENVLLNGKYLVKDKDNSDPWPEPVQSRWHDNRLFTVYDKQIMDTVVFQGISECSQKTGVCPTSIYNRINGIVAYDKPINDRFILRGVFNQ